MLLVRPKRDHGPTGKDHNPIPQEKLRDDCDYHDLIMGERMGNRRGVPLSRVCKMSWMYGRMLYMTER